MLFRVLAKSPLFVKCMPSLPSGFPVSTFAKVALKSSAAFLS